MKKQKVQAKINLEALAGGAFSRTPIRIRNQRKHKLQLLHRDRIRPASLWILKTGENRHLLPLPN